ncbi:MAG TPA: hypothetical protein PKN33_20490 [Phycisphaerae bacterium]|nr:hypothetical protein [Phycisphaerae bacterium]
MSIATPKLGPLPNPFLYDGYILPAFRLHDPDFGSPFDYPKPVTGTGTIPSQPYKDADENSRVRFRHLVNTGQAVTGSHQPLYPFKDTNDNNRIRLRKYPCEPFTPDPADRIWETGNLWKERPLASSDVAVGGSVSTFTASFTAESLGWVDPNGTPPYVIPEDYFECYWVRWLTGDNAGLTSQIAASLNNVLTLSTPVPNPIIAADAFDIIRQPEPRIRGRHFQRRRVLGVQNYPNIRAGGRSSVIVPHTFRIKITDFEPITNPLSSPHTQWSWFGFTNWSDVLSETPNTWSTTVVQRVYVDDVLLDAEFFATANSIHSGAVRDGYGAWSGQFGASGNSLPSESKILLGENTVFNDTPSIPLPIRFYLEGVYVRTRELTSFFSTEGFAEVAAKPWWGMQWVFSAYDGAGHRLFDRDFAPYDNWVAGDFGEGPFLPTFPVDINWWGLVTASPAITWIPQVLPYVIGPMGHSNAGVSPFQPTHQFADNMFEPPYLTECDPVMGGTIKYNADEDGRPWVLGGVDTRYNVVTEVSS